MIKNKYTYLLFVLILIISLLLILSVFLLVNTDKNTKQYTGTGVFLKKEEIENIKQSLKDNMKTTSEDLNINNF